MSVQRGRAGLGLGREIGRSLAWATRNLNRNKARHAATFSAIALGVAGLDCLAGYVVRWEHTLEAISIYLNNTGTVAVFRKDGHKNHLARPLRYSLDAKERERILTLARASPGVEAASAVLQGQGLASNGTKTFPFVGIGVDPGLQKTFFAREDVRRWAADFTRLESGHDLWKHPQGNPVGLAKGLKLLLGDTTGGIQLLTQGFEGNFSAVDADVVQTFSTGVALSEDSRLRTTLASAEALFDTDGASWIAVFLEDAGKARSFAAQFAKRLEAEGLSVDVIAWQDERVSPFYVGVMNFLYMMGASFFLLIAGVVALAVVNSVLLTSLERFRETGTLRAVGYLPASLALGFATEVFLLGTLASATGCAVAHAVSAAVNSANLRFKPPGWADTVQFMLTPNLVSGLGVSLVLVGVATLAAFLTALHTARQPVVVLLGEQRN